MEFSWSLPLIILILTILFISTFISHGKRHTLPGPPKLPLIGNLHQLVSKTILPHRRLAELARIYGPLMYLTLGAVPTVVVSSADMAKEVMRTHDAVLCSRPKLMLSQILFYGCSDIALAPYGEYWRQVRKIATLELFTTSRVQAVGSIRVQEVMDLVKGLALESGTLVNLTEKIFDLTFNITLRTSMNKKGKDGKEFKTLFADMAAIASGLSIGDLYPSIKFIHAISGMQRKLEDLVKRADMLMNPIIEEHIINKQMDHKENAVEDLVDILLNFHNGDLHPSSNEFFLRIDNIKAIELFGAGSETSSTTIEWAISELLKNQRAMEKATDEVRRIHQGNGMIDDTNLAKLKYLKLVIKETLRLHPPFPLLVPRQSMDRCQVNGYEIDQNTRIFINAWAIGRDPKYWKDPDIFNPERFEGSLVDYKGNHFELIPFGSGRRICPGMGLGIAIIELALAMLLYHFDWKLPQGTTPDDIDMDETFGIVARRKNELHVIPIAHNHPIS
ncbi:hypothetical protein KSS87_009663 [Heliosperma pusillum]|nr:hypothetical protein KSS87_009663 [Heliosperma pusillum]